MASASMATDAAQPAGAVSGDSKRMEVVRLTAPASAPSGDTLPSRLVDNGEDHPSSSSPVDEKYYALVIDSGAVIKQSGFATLHNSAQNYYTVPAVLSEIRDPQSRRHLEQFLAILPSPGLRTRNPSGEGIRAVSDFARKTGDYAQLSGADLQVLALLYDLEREGCDGDMGHVRREPKRRLGVHVTPLNGDAASTRGEGESAPVPVVESFVGNGGGDSIDLEGVKNVIIDPSDVDVGYDDDDDVAGDHEGEHEAMKDGMGGLIDENSSNTSTVCARVVAVSSNATAGTGSASPSKPKTWAVLVNPTAATPAPVPTLSLSALQETTVDMVKQATHTQTTSTDADVDADASKSSVKKDAEHCDLPLECINSAKEDNIEGQFDDASEDEEEKNDGSGDINDKNVESDNEEDGIRIADAVSDAEISDEECEVFVLEPHEASYFKRLKDQKQQDLTIPQCKRPGSGQVERSTHEDPVSIPEEEGGGLDSEFPSLAAAAEVRFEETDDAGGEVEKGDTPCKMSNEAQFREVWEEEEKERKVRALRPKIIGGSKAQPRLYNSFRKYGGIVSSGGTADAVKKRLDAPKDASKDSDARDAGESKQYFDSNVGGSTKEQELKSRILGTGGSSAAAVLSSGAAMTAEDDDGEGWVTCTRDIYAVKATGSMNFCGRDSSKKHSDQRLPQGPVGPPASRRAACATTDFAMQNVILQMNLELLTVDGVRVRRLKSWVTRCAACFTVYAGGDDAGKGGAVGRLFCDKCGSNALQRIAASVDRKTGRLKLHMKKNYRHNTRGTKFSMPKPGKGNKYNGDLLLTEDQLLYGAWAQRVKKGKPKSSCESMFGSDLASDLGCRADLTKRDDIKVGLGRKNPNATRFGRERRGKKKKNEKEKACGLRRY